MGLLDRVLFEEDPPGVSSQCRRFQTKSLHRNIDNYTVTKAGRLYLTRSSRFEFEDATGTTAPEGSIDINFHGEIRLISESGPIEEYVARFSHGTLEWMRPLAEVIVTTT